MGKTRHLLTRRIGIAAATLLCCASVWAQAAAPEAASTPAPTAESFAPGVLRYEDVPYQSLLGYHSQLADIYFPAGSDPAYPAVVFVHGGGWGMGSARMAGLPDKLAALSTRGYVVMAINYRFYGEAKFPAQIQDTKAAIRWLRSNAAMYKVDPRKVAIWGESAGGYLAALAGTSCGVSALEPPVQAAGRAVPGETQIKVDPGLSDCVQAVVDFYGPTDFAKMDQQALAGSMVHNAASSPESQLLGCALPQCANELLNTSNAVGYVDSRDPPFLIVRGNNDHAVPPGQSDELAAALTAQGVEVTLKRVNGADHMFAGASDAQKQDIQASVYAFLEKTLNSHQ